MKKEEIVKSLKELQKLTKGKRIYGMVTKVAPSGMSRNIKLFVCNNNEIISITYYVAKILDKSLKDDGSISVKGCGMDMIFNTLYNINSVAMEYGVIKESKNRDKHTLQYKGVVNTSYSYLS